MAKLYRMGAEGKRRQPENSAADGPKSVRFDLDDLNGSGSGGEQKQQQILTHIQERFPGFFEMPERCVPFEMSLTVDKLEGIEEQGFPEVLKLPSNNSELTANARSNVDAEQNESEAKIGRTKSLFAQSMDRTIRQLIFPKKEKSPNEDQKNTEAIKNLQIIEAEGMEGKNFVGGSEYTRVATDPMQMDLASKCLGNMWPRMEQQITRLFDKLKCPPKSNESTQIGGSSKHTILCQARQKLDDIRSLYLEQIESEESQNRVWTFPRSGGNPIGDSAWMLMPIRRVLDAIQRRSSPVATSDDIEIVRMCMLWTVLLWRERPALFRAFVFVNPSGFYCRLAEIFLIGPELFIGDDITKSCLSIIIEEFLATIGQKGQLLFRLREPIACLDTFEAFYGELLQRFEDFSSGDANFSLVLLIGAYMNSSKIDGLLMAQALWSPQRNIIRQMTLRSEENAMQILLNFLAEERQVDSTICGEDNARIEQEEANLKTFYAEAMTSGKINAERNPAVYKIASSASPPCIEPMGLLQTPTYLKC